MLIAAPVFAIATTRSVWRDRKAGSWIMSQTCATGAAWSGSWTSVITGTPKVCLISWKIFRPSSRPGPRNECDRGTVGLVERGLEHVGNPSFAQISTYASATCSARSRDSSTFTPPNSTNGPVVERASMDAGSRGIDPGVKMTCGRSVAHGRAPARSAMAASTIAGEQRMTVARRRGELGVELAGHEPRVIGHLDHLDQRVIGRPARDRAAPPPAGAAGNCC